MLANVSQDYFNCNKAIGKMRFKSRDRLLNCSIAQGGDTNLDPISRKPKSLSVDLFDLDDR